MAKGGRRPGAGRPAGSPNKITAALKDMILQSLSNQGGVAYLDAIAQSHPPVYCALLGRVLPIQQEHSGPDGKPLTVIQRLNVPKKLGSGE